MARISQKHDLPPVLDAAHAWIKECLIEDGSVFSNEEIWTQPLAEELKKWVIDRPDGSKRNFLVKLQDQLEPASRAGRRLMAEVLWAISLFPINAKPPSKRNLAGKIWEMGGSSIPDDHPMLSDPVLSGIGSAGTAFQTQRWRETNYLIELVIKLKKLPKSERQKLFSSYQILADWLEAETPLQQRQYPHILRYFAFPDEVERISSSREKIKILNEFGVEAQKNWTQRRMDEELLTLRQRLEESLPGEDVDFYDSSEMLESFRVTKSADPEPDPASPSEAQEEQAEWENSKSNRPINRILYGPPGTGKTYTLQCLQARYVEKPEAKDRNAWLEVLVSNFGWRAIAATAIADLGAASVPSIRDHELVIAHTRSRGISRNIGQQLWGTLQRHTPASVETVQFGKRASPFIFTKDKKSVWSLVEDWEDLDEEAAQLAKLYAEGPTDRAPTIVRFRQVTFHPSFSYEDFVRGIRPVATGDDGRTEFRIVDGVFKQICDEAAANPNKRYALFIDEINRANIAKVFGELITLIEPDKRLRFDSEGHPVGGMSVQLPGSGNEEVVELPFGVPVNLDIYGTMNTADRSIAQLDIALRRRFEFNEIEPNYSLLGAEVDGIDLASLLRRINDRLKYLLDRDHRIGHAYLMKVKDLPELRSVFAHQIIPLLQEYFFDDLSKVALTLATDRGSSPFVKKETLQHEALFPGAPRQHGTAGRDRYTISDSSGWKTKDFKALYTLDSASEQFSEDT